MVLFVSVHGKNHLNLSSLSAKGQHLWNSQHLDDNSRNRAWQWNLVFFIPESTVFGDVALSEKKQRGDVGLTSGWFGMTSTCVFFDVHPRWVTAVIYAIPPAIHGISGLYRYISYVLYIYICIHTVFDYICNVHIFVGLMVDSKLLNHLCYMECSNLGCPEEQQEPVSPYGRIHRADESWLPVQS